MESNFHKQAKTLFLEAREISPEAAQIEFVKSHAKGNTALAKEVLDLLQNDKEETILSRDKTAPIESKIDPFGLDSFKNDAKGNKLQSALFSSRGRAGLAFLVVALVIGFLGYMASTNTKKALAEIRGQETEAILNSNVAALQLWIENYQASTEMLLEDDKLAELIQKLVADSKNDALLYEADSMVSVYLNHVSGYSYIVTDLSGEVILSPNTAFIGKRVGDRFGKEIYAVAGGKSQFFLPFYQQENSRQQEYYTEKPLVWMQVPVRDKTGNVIATFGIGRSADTDFTRILRTARLGETGETYAINKEGWFVSESRFEAEMRGTGLLHKDTNVSSILNYQARKRSYELSHDFTHLTDLASAVLAGANASNDAASSGVITNPSEDYKGTEVIGAWAWLPQYEFGVISQVDAAEAFAPVKYVNRLIAVVVFFLVVAGFYSFYNAFQVVKIQGVLNSAVQMGQYELKKRIAEGGMGAVYMAEHRLLKRPTAIKVIRVDKKDDSLSKRFTREVQLVSQLSNPNTIEIFDYGFTQDNQAYFAMEFVAGTNLSEEVQRCGAMPAGRVVHIIKQVCASLLEAHTLGIVHRDIKPQNIMLTNRIGLPDFVKVLDFGLAKPLYETGGEDETRAITGTPVYIAPERLKRPGLAEASADIYAVGALMYFLLSGKPIFSYSSDLDILYQVLNDEPKPLPSSVPEVLSRLTFFCLEKDPENRPTSIEELKMFLDNLSANIPWNPAQPDA